MSLAGTWRYTARLSTNLERAEQSAVADQAQGNIKFEVALYGIFATAFAIWWTIGITR